VTLRAKTASGFYYCFGSDLLKKRATDLRRLFSSWSAYTDVDDSCEIGSLSLNGRCRGNKFSSFSDMFRRRGRYFVMLSLHSAGSVAEWLACWTQAQKAWVQIAAAALSGNSLRQTVHTHFASVHQAAKLVAPLLRVAGVTGGK